MTYLFLGITDPQEANELKAISIYEIRCKVAVGDCTQLEADTLIVELLEDYYQWLDEQNN